MTNNGSHDTTHATKERLYTHNYDPAVNVGVPEGLVLP
jgi:hypothetical protein